MNGEFGNDLAVQLDAGLGQPMHELAVTDTLGAAGRVDPDDPELAEFRLALAAVRVGVGLGTIDGILGLAKEA